MLNEVRITSDELRSEQKFNQSFIKNKATSAPSFNDHSSIFESFPEPDKVTFLDLSQLNEKYDLDNYYEGTLPSWLRYFKNLRVLKAQNLGILYIEEWIVELRELRMLFLDNNLISTWPYFILKLPKIKCASFHNNPCLRSLMMKSPTFKERYYNWQTTATNRRSLPSYIRGPEWDIAASARTKVINAIHDFGFYCGGVYTQLAPSDLSNDGCVTILSPCLLHLRRNKLIEGKLDTWKENKSPFLPVATIDPSFELGVDPDLEHQFQILLYLFKDIDILLKRNVIQKEFKNKNSQTLKDGVVLTENIDVTVLDTIMTFSGSCKTMSCRSACAPLTASNKETLKWLIKLLNGEDKYILLLQFASHQHSKHSMGHNPFQDLITSHKRLQCVFTTLTSSYNSNPGEVNVQHCITDLVNTIIELQDSFSDYASRFSEYEHLVQEGSSIFSLYHSKEVEEYVVHHANKLNGFARMIAAAKSGLSERKLRPSIRERYKWHYAGSSSNNQTVHKQGNVMSAPKFLKEWISDQLGPITDCKESAYFYSPLIRLVFYVRIFSILAIVNDAYKPVLKTLQTLKAKTAATIQTSRELERAKVLSIKYRSGIDMFKDYKWDAGLSIHSRTYLEPGILRLKTNDIIDGVTGKSASVVKEIYKVEKPKVMRMVCCENRILLFDDIFESIVLNTSEQDISIISEGSKIRITFNNVRETCIASVKSFSARYMSGSDHAKELLQAVLLDKTIIL